MPASEKLQRAKKHLEEQLNWVGPSGKTQAIITLPRELAIETHGFIEKKMEE